MAFVQSRDRAHGQSIPSWGVPSSSYSYYGGARTMGTSGTGSSRPPRHSISQCRSRGTHRCLSLTVAQRTEARMRTGRRHRTSKACDPSWNRLLLAFWAVSNLDKISRALAGEIPAQGNRTWHIQIVGNNRSSVQSRCSAQRRPLGAQRVASSRYGNRPHRSYSTSYCSYLYPDPGVSQTGIKTGGVGHLGSWCYSLSFFNPVSLGTHGSYSASGIGGSHCISEGGLR